MKKLLFFLLPAILLVSCNQAQKTKQMALHYPQPKRVDSSSTFFGVVVKDPYRWMENENDPALKQWIKQEQSLTEKYLSQIPYRSALYKRLKQLYNYQRQTAPFYKGGWFFFFKNNGLQNQSVLYVQKNLNSKPEILLDPNKFSKDGTVALSTFSVSNDGKYLGYAISRSGSDWQEIHVRNIQTKKDLPDTIKWAKFSGITWYKDGFFYCRYPQPPKGQVLTEQNINQKVYYHKLGTDQKQDKLVFQDPQNPQNGFSVDISSDEHFLVIFEWHGTSGMKVFFKDLTKPNSKFVPINNNYKYDFFFVDDLDGKLLFVTNDNAPNYKLIAVDPNNPQPEHWQDLLPERNYPLKSVQIADNNIIIARYLKDVVSYIDVFDHTGKLLYHLNLTAPGTASISSSKKLNFGFITLTSYTYPGTIFKFDIQTGKLQKYWEPKLNGIDLNNYVTEEKFYKSFDGTKIPIFIVHKKDIKLNHKNPAWLYGYGGFDISITPYFSPIRLLWLENGGVFAVANIRGGGEYGEKWHEQGMLLHKKNVFKDFIWAAKYLINQGYTDSTLLVIQGASNGGLLIGAVMNMDPTLFKVAFPQVGVMDMLRYYKFTIGRAWASDYGLPTQSKQMFEYIYSYSPLHNIRCGKNRVYPATMVMTADHDDRVVPAHSFKYIATLQYKCKNNPNPLLIRIEHKAGHGGGKPVSKILQEWADMYAFAYWNLGIEPKVSIQKAQNQQ